MEILEVKKKYEMDLLKIDGVHGVGLRVNEHKIVVYVNKITSELLLLIPHELEGYLVDVKIENQPVVKYYNSGSSIYYDVMKKRPIPAGTSIGQGMVSAGTIGSWWYSPYYKKNIGVSNNHVFADANRSGKKQTVSTSFTILDGGVKGTEQYYLRFPSSPYKFDTQADFPSITSISPSSGKVGDLITITGKSLRARWGNSKIYFNGIEAKVNYWEGDTSNCIYDVDGYVTYYHGLNTTIKVYIPEGVTVGNATLSIELEGDPILSPGRYDNGCVNATSNYGIDSDIIGETLNYLRVGTNPDTQDVALISMFNENDIDPYIYGQGALGEHSEINQTNIFTNLKYKPVGIMMTPYEGLAVMKTGRTTGTTVSYIDDVHFTVDVGYVNEYGNAFFATKSDVIKIHGLYNTSNQLVPNLYFIRGGDSGSSLVTCPKEIFDQFNSAFGVYAPNTVIFDTPYQFIGNVFAGDDSGAGNESDKYANWGTGAFALEVIDVTPSITGTSKSYSTMNVVFEISNTFVIGMVASNLSYGCLSIEIVPNTIDVDSPINFKLEPYNKPIDNLQVNFELTNTSTNTTLVQISMNAKSISKCQFSIYASLLLNKISISSRSSGTLKFNGTFIIPQFQIENIYLSISQSVDLNFAI